MKNLAHSASFHPNVKIAPSNPGIKHLTSPFSAASTENEPNPLASPHGSVRTAKKQSSAAIMPSESDRQTLLTLLNAGQLEPFIQHIRFPRFKNLAPDTRIDFTYPITALVGSNGTNKSSVLRALQGAPGANNLGNYWFSTSVDPIEETGDRPNCFIYGYFHKTDERTVEVLKTRIRRENDPDYWEPSRPLVRYGMERRHIEGQKRSRWENIRKEVVYVDFRQYLSAFDKTFY
ncbi:ATP-binding protein [Methylobacterium sp. CM6244]